MHRGVLFALLLLSSTAHAQIVNIDALNNRFITSPVSIFLTAGTYTVEVIGTADGGAYDTWHFQNEVIAGCDGAGTNCAVGWINRYRIDSVGLAAPVSIQSANEHYETPAISLANALDTSFVLLSDALVDFSIVDSFYPDNSGGMSLEVSAVPVPGAALLFFSGFAAITARRRARVQAL